MNQIKNDSVSGSVNQSADTQKHKQIEEIYEPLLTTRKCENVGQSLKQTANETGYACWLEWVGLELENK